MNTGGKVLFFIHHTVSRFVQFHFKTYKALYIL